MPDSRLQSFLIIELNSPTAKFTKRISRPAIKSFERKSVVLIPLYDLLSVSFTASADIKTAIKDRKTEEKTA